MPHPQPESPSPQPTLHPTPFGATAVRSALERFTFPVSTDDLARLAGDREITFRRDQSVRLDEAVRLLPPRVFDSLDEAAASLFGALDERRGSDRRVAPPRFGAGDLLAD